MNDVLYVGKHALTRNVTWHEHSSWELIYCTGGSGILQFKDKSLHYELDSVAIIPPMTPHANVSQEGFTNIHMNIDDCTLAFRESVVMPAGPQNLLLNLFAATFYYYSSNQIERALLLPSYGQLIVNTLSLYQPEQLHSQLVQQIETHILQNYPDPDFDLNGYLQSLPFSFEYLKKLFKKEIGLTPLQFLTDKRLENAAGHLAASHDRGNISETARMCGFNEPLYFSRLFKKKYGVAPRNFTAEHLKEPVATPEEMKIIL
jgi:AraC-like DNA-binding protein